MSHLHCYQRAVIESIVILLALLKLYACRALCQVNSDALLLNFAYKVKLLLYQSFKAEAYARKLLPL